MLQKLSIDLQLHTASQNNRKSTHHFAASRDAMDQRQSDDEGTAHIALSMDEQRRQMTSALNDALEEIDPELHEAIFDDLLRLIVNYVPFRESPMSTTGLCESSHRSFFYVSLVESELLSTDLKLQIDAMIGGSNDGVDRDWRLIYRATRDGANPETSHRLCDGHAPTVTVARVEDGPVGVCSVRINAPRLCHRTSSLTAIASVAVIDLDAASDMLLSVCGLLT